MSHTTCIDDAPFKDVDCLNEAAKALAKMGINCRLVKGTAPRMWFRDQFTKAYGPEAAYVLELPDCRFDVGFVKKEGKLMPVFDPHGGLVGELIGNKNYEGYDRSKAETHIRALTAQYLYAVQLKACKAAGYQITKKEVKADGTIRIRATCN